MGWKELEEESKKADCDYRVSIFIFKSPAPFSREFKQADLKLTLDNPCGGDRL